MDNKLYAKFFKYVVTGGTSALVDIGVFAALQHFGVTTAQAATLSFLVAAFVNYRLTAHFVFQKAATNRRFALFLLGALVGLSINLSVTVYAEGLLHIGAVLAKVLGVAVAFGFNFTVNLLIVFRVRHGDRRQLLLMD